MTVELKEVVLGFHRRTSFALIALAVGLSSPRIAFAQDASKPTGGAPAASSSSTTKSDAPAQQDDSKARVRYVVAGEQGAKVRNFYDVAGIDVLDVAKGGLLAVYRERGDWLEVEAPGGFPVWVFGEYVKPTADTGVLEVTASSLRQRPTPSSDATSYALQPVLAKGTHLRFIARNDEKKALSEDWIKVYSAPGTRAWVAKSEVESLGAGQDGATLWAKAVLDSSQRPVVAVAGATIPASAPKGDAKNPDSNNGLAKADGKVQASPEKARKLLRDADAALEAAKAKQQAGGTPDFAAVRQKYDDAGLYAGTDKDLIETIKKRVELVDTLASAADVRAQLLTQKSELDQAKLERERKLKEAEKQHDIFAGRFDGRGWLEKVTFAGQPTAYRLRYGGNVIAEVVCNSGRYDLDAFLNYDVGIQGHELRGAQSSPGDIAVKARVLDVSSIEVISGRASQ